MTTRVLYRRLALPVVSSTFARRHSPFCRSSPLTREGHSICARCVARAPVQALKVRAEDGRAVTRCARTGFGLSLGSGFWVWAVAALNVWPLRHAVAAPLICSLRAERLCPAFATSLHHDSSGGFRMWQLVGRDLFALNSSACEPAEVAFRHGQPD
eukprot:4527640-Pleurochrysis_carterae.AAC.1